MTILSHQLPDLQTVTTELNALLTRNGFTTSPICMIDREPNIYTSTFPAEIVTCELAETGIVYLLLKYSHGALDPNYSAISHNHRGGALYEAHVYEEILSRSESSVVKFYGKFVIPKNRQFCLVMQYLKGSQRANKFEDGALRATRWAAKFHAGNANRRVDAAPGWLNRYDGDYYRGWAWRTLEQTKPFVGEFTWLPELCKRFEEVVPELLGTPQTVIHGEFVPSNIHVREGLVYPIDWESAALGPGEVDIVAVTDNWKPAVVEHCLEEYQRLRWPDGPPANFRRTLEAARIYWQMRWLGDDGPAGELARRSPRRLHSMHSAAQSLGLVG